MCAVCFSAYQLIPTGAVWARARWVRRAGGAAAAPGVGSVDPATGGEPRLAVESVESFESFESFESAESVESATAAR